MTRHPESAIVLASASPRRKELLESAGIRFSVAAADVPEELLPGEKPEDFVLRLSAEKARASSSAAPQGRYFIGADTVVVCSEEIMGKPADAGEAERMLLALSGRTHEVLTGFAIFDRRDERLYRRSVRTEVTFKELDRTEILAYIATGCPFDKAGSYAIQGGAAYMVRRIDGSYTNVVGLPLCEVVEALAAMGALESPEGAACR